MAMSPTRIGSGTNMLKSFRHNTAEKEKRYYDLLSLSLFTHLVLVAFLLLPLLFFTLFIVRPPLPSLAVTASRDAIIPSSVTHRS